jgi:hypothetical protein
MTDTLKPNRARFWLFQLAGWSLFAMVSALGALPYRDGRPILLYFVATAVAGFLASIPLRVVCLRLWKPEPSWPKVIGITAACCYLLGLACSLTGAVAEAQLGHANAHVSAWGAVLLVGFSNAFSPTIALMAWSGIYFGVKQWEEANRREQRLLKTVALARDAELRALRYQITPHFLFNTLNGISTLVGEEQIQPARRMISLLADFLRSTLEPAERGDVTLAEELRQVQQYIAIEQIRLGDRMQVSITSDEKVRDVLVPHLLLQPLVENAIRHGIAPYLEGGQLSLRTMVHGSFVRITIHNTYGLTENHRPPHNRAPGGLGLVNTAERLLARYGEDHRFSVSSDEDRGWCVVLDVPRHANREFA